MKIKVVTFQFPPNGGSGVQRIVKFLKYWHAFAKTNERQYVFEVITSKSVLSATKDDSHVSDLADDVVINRYISLDPMFVTNIFNTGSARGQHQKNHSLKSVVLKMVRRMFIWIRDLMRLPDQYFLWALYSAMREIFKGRESKADIVFTTIPTYSSAFLGSFLSWYYNCPHVIDFRDSWSDDPYLNLPTIFHKKFHQFWEKRILSRASLLVVYNQWLFDIYQEKYPNIPCTVVTNGYDPADLKKGKVQNVTKKDVISYVYTGTIFEYHEEFIREIFKFFGNQKDLKFELIFAGEIQLLNFDSIVEEFGLVDKVNILGYLPHVESVGLLLEADILLFTVPNGDTSSLTGKIFEYLGVCKPILSVIQKNSSIETLLDKHGHHDFCSFYDQKSLQLANENALKVFNRFKGTRNLTDINRQHQAVDLIKQIQFLKEKK